MKDLNTPHYMTKSPLGTQRNVTCGTHGRRVSPEESALWPRQIASPLKHNLHPPAPPGACGPAATTGFRAGRASARGEAPAPGAAEMSFRHPLPHVNTQCNYFKYTLAPRFMGEIKLK